MVVIKGSQDSTWLGEPGLPVDWTVGSHVALVAQNRVFRFFIASVQRVDPCLHHFTRSLFLKTINAALRLARQTRSAGKFSDLSCLLLSHHKDERLSSFSIDFDCQLPSSVLPLHSHAHLAILSLVESEAQPHSLHSTFCHHATRCFLSIVMGPTHISITNRLSLLLISFLRNSTHKGARRFPVYSEDITTNPIKLPVPSNPKPYEVLLSLTYSNPRNTI